MWARDIVAEKVEALSRGEVPIHEPGLPELVAKNAERLHFTTEMADVLDNAQLLFVCVDTPPTYSGDADLSRVEAVIADLADSDEHALVMKSTVPVGTGRGVQRRRDGLGYVSNPEFLKEGSAVDDFMKPDRVVVGADAHSTAYASEPASAPTTTRSGFMKSATALPSFKNSGFDTYAMPLRRRSIERPVPTGTVLFITSACSFESPSSPITASTRERSASPE